MDNIFTITNCIIGLLVLMGLTFIVNAIRIVPEYRRLVVLRFGRCVGTKGPGIVLIIPVMDKAINVDLRESVREIPTQTAITLDNAPINIDFLWYFKLFDPVQSVLAVGDFELAAQGIATTTLRSVIGGILLDDVLSQREQINNSLRVRLDEVTERWGVKVTNVEIREITPPRDVQDSMNRQLTAERERRAMVTQSTGRREAEINVAQGEKQAAILKAEGSKEAAILVAEGQRQAQLLMAEGYADALDKIYSVANKVDKQTMTLQYFETLKKMGEGASSKFIFPMEFTSMLSDFVEKNKK
jgi:regulator of protease activity HflC (stomatin/prohibitin superfamily)